VIVFGYAERGRTREKRRRPVTANLTLVGRIG